MTAELLRCPRCQAMAHARHGLGLPAYRLWRCETCAALFDRRGRIPPEPSTSEEQRSANQIRLGLRIRDTREARHLTQRELALLAGISPSYLSEIEGGTANPVFDKLVRLATALEVGTGALMSGFKQTARVARRGDRFAETESRAQ